MTRQKDPVEREGPIRSVPAGHLGPAEEGSGRLRRFPTGKKAVVVLGMHRSGTSAVTRMLSLLGAKLPTVLMPPQSDNDLGFWEPLDIVDIHDEMLESAGTSWHDVSPFPDAWTDSGAAAESREKILEILRRDFSETRLFVLKDPRVSRFVPFWQSVLTEFGADPHYVICVRNPLEVAASLRARNGFLPAKSYLLWLWHVLEAERTTRRERRSFVLYDELLRDWRQAALNLEADLEITWPRRAVQAEVEIDEFISPRHRHQRSTTEDVETRTDLVHWVKRVYGALRQAVLDREEAPTETLDAIRHELRTADVAYGPLVALGRIRLQYATARAERLAEEIERIRGRVAELESAEPPTPAPDAPEIVQLEAELETSRRKQEALWEGVREAIAAAAAHEQELDSLRWDISVREREMERLARESSLKGEENRGLTAALEAAGVARAEAVEQLGRAQEQRKALESQLAEATERGQELEGRFAEATEEREELAARLAGAGHEADRLGRTVAERERDLEARQMEVDALQGEIDLGRAHAAELEQAVGEREGALETVLTSKSWTLTRPLRQLMALRSNLRARLARRRLVRGWRRLFDSTGAAALFDREHYLGQLDNPEEAESDPALHYLDHGAAHGLAPHPLFDTRFYVHYLQAPLPAGVDPLLHFVSGGAADGHDPHPLFMSDFYLAAHPEVAEAGVNPLWHFVSEGAERGWNPLPIWDTSFYLAANPDVAESGVNPLAHWSQVGVAEGRHPHPLFDTSYYLENNPEIAATGENPLRHFLSQGAAKGLDPHPLFDTSYYLENNPEVAASGDNPLWHFIARGATEQRSPHPLFDSPFYCREHPEVPETGINPLCHFLEFGAGQGWDPHPLFDTSFYLESNPDVAQSGENPLVHFIITGAKDGRDPHPLFDTAFYLGENPEVASAGRNPLEHYLTEGAAAGRDPHPLFDGDHYLASVPGAAASRTPLEHYFGADPKVTVDLADDTSLSDSEIRRALAEEIAGRRRSAVEAVQPTPLDLDARTGGDLRRALRRLAIPATDRPEVSIVLPARGDWTDAARCLLALADHTELDRVEILVLDDGLGEEEADLLRSIPNLRYLRNPTGSGFPSCANRGAEEARGGYLVFLRPRTRVRQGWLAALLEIASQGEGIGIVGPKLLSPDGALQEAGATLGPDGGVRPIGRGSHPGEPRFKYSRDVDCVSSACLLVRKDVFEEVGGLSDRCPPDSLEHVDLCLAARRKGYRVVYAPEAAVAIVPDGDGHVLGRQRITVEPPGQRLLSQWHSEIAKLNEVRVIATYLPQFHPIPENDRWWGPGFTDWSNVIRARPLFDGHVQPRIATDLGVYDLRVPEVMEQQAELAKRYGIHGFCFYYYSFEGQRLLEKPVERILEQNVPDIPFCLAWANESWTRRWDGQEDDVLIEQRHTPESDLALIRDVARFFEHPNYIRIDDRPLFLVYRIGLMGDVRSTADAWREECRRLGLGEIYLAYFESFELAEAAESPLGKGFDAAVEFPPHNAQGPIPGPAEFEGTLFDYREQVVETMTRTIPAYTRFRGVMPGWDNTARRGDKATVFARSSPGAYQAWLEAAIRDVRQQCFGDERLVFVNAWNEWAEGAYLEPDEAHGRRYLEATRAALEGALGGG